MQTCPNLHYNLASEATFTWQYNTKWIINTALNQIISSFSGTFSRLIRIFLKPRPSSLAYFEWLMSNTNLHVLRNKFTCFFGNEHYYVCVVSLAVWCGNWTQFWCCTLLSLSPVSLFQMLIIFNCGFYCRCHSATDRLWFHSVARCICESVWCFLENKSWITKYPLRLLIMF